MLFLKWLGGGAYELSAQLGITLTLIAAQFYHLNEHLNAQFILIAHNIKWGSVDSVIYFVRPNSSTKQCDESFKISLLTLSHMVFLVLILHGGQICETS